MGLSIWRVKPAVLAALATLIPTDADIVALGLPAAVPSNQKPRRVYILNVPVDDPIPIYVPGTQLRKEEYVIPLALEVVNFSGRSLTGFADTEQTMARLVGAIETLCGADPSWDGTAHQSGLSLAAESTGPIADQSGTGWISKAVLQLHIMRMGV